MSLLRQEPDLVATTLDQLLAVAAAMEGEAVRLYRGLAEDMTRRGEEAVATVFRQLATLEERHVGTVAAFSQQVLGHPAPPFPAGDASVSTRVVQPAADEAVSVSMTPYRALSIAVRTEERAFAFYTYLAANTTDPTVRDTAEALAGEELHHAALLRIERRRAFRQDPRRIRPPLPEHPEALAALAAALDAEVAQTLETLHQRYPESDAEAEALRSLLPRMARRARARLEAHGGPASAAAAPPGLASALLAAPAPPACPPTASAHQRAAFAHLCALRLLERLYEVYASISERTDQEAVLAAALSLAEAVLADIILMRERVREDRQ
jgi:rubrerythrin